MTAERRERYEPGDVFTYKDAEFVAVRDRINGCKHCIGDQHDNVCGVLPTGCGRDELVWKPHNNQAKALAVTLRLEE